MELACTMTLVQCRADSHLGIILQSAQVREAGTIVKTLDPEFQRHFCLCCGKLHLETGFHTGAYLRNQLVPNVILLCGLFVGCRFGWLGVFFCLFVLFLFIFFSFL